MYESLKPWINLPAQIKPFIRRNGAGTKLYGDAVDIQCYAEGNVVVTTDNSGTEVVSNKQLYIDGSVTISELDCIVFEGSEKSIKSIGTFYRNGKPDIKVVYL